MNETGKKIMSELKAQDFQEIENGILDEYIGKNEEVVDGEFEVVETKDLQNTDTQPIKDNIPSMNISIGEENKKELDSLIDDQKLIGLYSEIIDEIKQDKNELKEIIDSFKDMVLNDGDSSNAAKESLVNLLKLYVDQSDKKAKIAELMTRVKLKDRDTFPKYLAASQTNNINIGSSSKKKIIQALNRKTKDKEKPRDEK